MGEVGMEKKFEAITCVGVRVDLQSGWGAEAPDLKVLDSS